MFRRLWVNLIRPFHMGDAERWSDQVDRAFGITTPTRTDETGLAERSCINSAQHGPHKWFPAPFDSKFGDVYYTCPGRLDPSTIRDVAPPKRDDRG